jgi:hypothetical protein
VTTAFTSLLGFALPVTGELSGTWGDEVNNSITQLVEDSVANNATQSVTSANWTLTTTGSGASNQARMAILIPTGTPGVSRNIVAPASSKAYVVINQSDSQVVLKASATTGVIIPTGVTMLCAWNGSDFTAVTALTLSVGTTAQRPSTPATGMLRYNTTLSQFEGYDGTQWGGIGGAQAGGVIQTNKTEVMVNYTMPSGTNGLSVGPVTIDSGVSVTITSGQRWLVF